MSNLVLDWRFGAYFLQVVQWSDWDVVSTLYWRSKGIYYRDLPVGLRYNQNFADKSMTFGKMFSLSAWRDWFERF
jgi:hypothetical protein